MAMVVLVENKLKKNIKKSINPVYIYIYIYLCTPLYGHAKARSNLYSAYYSSDVSNLSCVLFIHFFI